MNIPESIKFKWCIKIRRNVLLTVKPQVVNLSVIQKYNQPGRAAAITSFQSPWIVCMHLLNTDFVKYFLSLKSIYGFKTTFATGTVHSFASFYCYYGVSLFVFAVFSHWYLTVILLVGQERRMLWIDIQKMLLGNHAIVQPSQQYFFFPQYIVVSLFGARNMSTLGLSQVFTTHHSGYVISLWAGVLNIYKINKIHFAKPWKLLWQILLILSHLFALLIENN